MEQKSGYEPSTEFSNERAVAWARQMMARKCARQNQMVEEYKTNYKLQAALEQLRTERLTSKKDADAPYEFITGTFDRLISGQNDAKP